MIRVKHITITLLLLIFIALNFTAIYHIYNNYKTNIGNLEYTINHNALCQIILLLDVFIILGAFVFLGSIIVDNWNKKVF